ncbi:MAG: hypothetical protein V1922_04105 [bacterium]
MDKVIFSYIKTHTLLILTLLATAFLVLAIGEVVLYRNVIKLNEMLSEGLIQIKESKQINQTPTTTIKQMNLPK